MANTVLDKKLEKATDYGNADGLFNLTCDQELRVTITLAEYRYLVTQDATKKEQIKKAVEDKYSRNQENEALKKENAALKTELYELKKTLDAATEQAASQETIEIPATGTFSPEAIGRKVGF